MTLTACGRYLLGCLAASAATAAFADEALLTIPPESAGEAAHLRVKRLLPPHVGCAVLVIGTNYAGEEVVFKRAFGYRKLRPGAAETADQVRATPSTNFRVGSLTKVFTAAAVLQLADEGRLSLDDPLHQWLPSAERYAGPATVRHLLTHSSGILGYQALTAARVGPLVNDLSLLGALAQAGRTDFPAGTRCIYSDTGYALLGLLVQQVTQRPLHVYLRDRVLEPIGMGSSVLLVEGLNVVPERADGCLFGSMTTRDQARVKSLKQQIDRLAELRVRIGQQGGDLQGIDARVRAVERQLAALSVPEDTHALPGLDASQWRQDENGSTPQMSGDFGLYASIDDLQRLAEALNARELPLSASATELWLSPQSAPLPTTPDGAAGRRYTCGWVYDERLGEPRLSHRGDAHGFRQTFQWLPESGRAVAVLTNSVAPAKAATTVWDEAGMQLLGEQVMQAVLGETGDRDGLIRLGEPVELGEASDREE